MKKTKEQRREYEILSEMGRCEHFTGIQHDTCKAGVNIRQLVGGPDFGWAARLPCLLADSDKCEVQCEKRSLPTRDEAEAAVNEHDTRLAKTMTAVSAAHADAKNKGLGAGYGGQSCMPCPLECGGALNYSVEACNGHIHAACSTPGCVSWME